MELKSRVEAFRFLRETPSCHLIQTPLQTERSEDSVNSCSEVCTYRREQNHNRIYYVPTPSITQSCEVRCELHLIHTSEGSNVHTLVEVPLYTH